ncbi:uncharacterized protein LOC122505447 [Leptopilina heterotoma]|uniref:uncharacterized protein LOC122505447 n=1 Tax=Leptopilina heterotoma TaxID=63436 RepID=UPI001CA7BF11|nr:uncharacterized protein LOC122505447 [Leptopilina heterotoma]
MSKEFSQLSKRHKSRLIREEVSNLSTFLALEIDGNEETEVCNDASTATNFFVNDCDMSDVETGNFEYSIDACSEVPSNSNDVLPEINESVNENAILDHLDDFDSDVVYSDLSDEDVYNSNYESDSSCNSENDLASELQDIVSEGHLSQKITNNLLRVLRKYGHGELPKDRRTLMKTPKNISFELDPLGEGNSSTLEAEYFPPMELLSNKKYVLGLVELLTSNSIPNID